jgi:hypothetical protein
MGYVRKKILNLQFADPDLEGLEVRVRQASIGQLVRFTELPQFKDAPVREQMAEIIGLLVSGLVGWNLEDPDPADQTGEATVPVLCTAEGMWTQDQTFLQIVLNAWMNASAGVSAPLEPSSTGGEQSPEASIPTETLSPSLPSSPPPS